MYAQGEEWACDAAIRGKKKAYLLGFLLFLAVLLDGEGLPVLPFPGDAGLLPLAFFTLLPLPPYPTFLIFSSEPGPEPRFSPGEVTRPPLWWLLPLPLPPPPPPPPVLLLLGLPLPRRR